MLGCANSKTWVDQSGMLGWPPSGEELSQFSCAHGEGGGQLFHAEVIGSAIPVPLRGRVSFSVRNEWLSPGHWEVEAAHYTSTHSSTHGSHGLLWKHGQWTLTQTPAAARPHTQTWPVAVAWTWMSSWPWRARCSPLTSRRTQQQYGPQTPDTYMAFDSNKSHEASTQTLAMAETR